jgi:hypothetical protein
MGGTENRATTPAMDGPHGVGAAEAWWMLCRSLGGRIEAMAVPCYGGQALALFDHEEDAGLYLRSLEDEGLDTGWWIRKTRRGEVVSVLCGPCAEAKHVILDPSPAMVADGTAALAGMDRTNFLANLLVPDGAEEGAHPRKWSHGRRAARRERNPWVSGHEGEAQEKLE